MNRKFFSIGWIIAAGFGLLIMFIVVVNFKTVQTLSRSSEMNKQIVTIHSPSVDKLQELKIMLLNSFAHISSWVNEEKEEHPDKLALVTLMDQGYPSLRKDIHDLSRYWSKNELEEVTKIFAEIDLLLGNYELIKSTLPSFESYTDPLAAFSAEETLFDSGERAKKISNMLDKLILEQRKNTQQDTNELLSSYAVLNFYVKKLGIFIVLAGILIAILIVWRVVSPVKQVKDQLLLLGQGIIPSKKIAPRSDEIGQMASALNNLLDSFNRTKEFAKEVGSGNFKVEYQPLSSEDVLGHSLLRMKTDLSELTGDLEKKVQERTIKIEEQKKEIETLLTHTTDSIRYAKRIQDAILPSNTYLKKTLSNSFVLFLPKDIVSGDFYWSMQIHGKTYIGAIDCTGHGVPGAFMTIIAFNALSKVSQRMQNDTSPGYILNTLNEEIISTFHRQGEDSIRDGMDVSICAIDEKNGVLEFAGAYNPLFYIRAGQLHEVPGNKMPIGVHFGDEAQKFETKSIKIEKGDIFYIFSDGYADQFGGPKGKKYRYQNFRELLLKVYQLDPDEQKRIMLLEHNLWKGSLEQVDDILVIGMSF